jgi:hypothetical protein
VLLVGDGLKRKPLLITRQQVGLEMNTVESREVKSTKAYTINDANPVYFSAGVTLVSTQVTNRHTFNRMGNYHFTFFGVWNRSNYQ